MDSPDDIVSLLRARASQGDSAVGLVGILREMMGEDFRVFSFIRYFQAAFEAPLRMLREAERWRGFTDEGTMSDDEFEHMLGPFIRKSDR